MRVCVRARARLLFHHCNFISCLFNLILGDFFFVRLFCKHDVFWKRVRRNKSSGGLEWKIQMDIYSSLMVPDPHPVAPLHLQRQKSRKKRKSNFEALNDESEEEVVDKREFYCFFCLQWGGGRFKGLKSKTLNLKNM